MIITRTERYTDWYYQGAQSTEVAATVGRGLLKGHIYYRYSHDALKEGDTLDREKSFVILSDGSEYELGTGLSSEKITIVYHGETSDKMVHIEVQGKDDVGVGVQSIQRDMTISYDDGKTPVLDTEQLNGILTKLSESLTESMKDTAESVKQELSNQIETVGIDLEAKCEKAVEASATTLRQEIKTATTGLNSAVADFNVKVQLMENKQAEIERNIANRILVAEWTVGRFTMNTEDHYVNLFFAPPRNPIGDTEFFRYNAPYKSMNMVTSAFPRGRILQFSGRLSLEIGEGFEGTISLILMNAAGSTLARHPLWIKGSDITNAARNSHYVNFQVSTYADATHAVCGTGVYVAAHKKGPQTVAVREDSHITMSVM